MEGIAYSLRIPQRKPWSSISDSAQSASKLLENRDQILDGAPDKSREDATKLVTELENGLDQLQLWVEEQNYEKVSLTVSDVLSSVAELKLLQTPGLPYLIPRAYNDQPRLIGRATVQLQLALKGGVEKTVEIVLDGYSAPVSCGAFVSNIERHVFDNQQLAVDADSVLLRVPDGIPSKPVPLEILPAGEFEPLYRTELDVQIGEVPVLPLSIFGAVSLSHAVEGEEQSSATEAFIFKFDRSTAGLGGMAFDEGQFAVIGYVTNGLQTIQSLKTGDTLVRAQITKGRENLIQPDPSV